MSNADRLAVSEQSLGLARDVIAHLGLAEGRGRLVVGVAGESGSGKSVVATSLARELAALGRRPCVLHQDDYFIRPPRTNHDHRMVDIASRTGPHEVRLDLIESHIAAFRAGETVEAPLVNYPANRFDTHTLTFADTDTLVVEGTYVLQLGGLDARIFLTATHQDTAERRRARNRDIDDPRVYQVLDIEHQLIAPQVNVADAVIDRHYVLHPGPRARA
jgi:uridine kinase